MKRAIIIPLVLLFIVLAYGASTVSRYYIPGVYTSWVKTDTSLAVDVDTLGLWVASRRTIDSLILANGTGGTARDSILRVGRIYTFTANMGSILNSDTSESRYFSGIEDYPYSDPVGRSIQGVAHVTLIPYSISISHRFVDTSPTIRRARDTSVIYSILDSIPVNNSFWFLYDPSSGGLVAGSYQKIILAKATPHLVATSVMDTDPVQVPLILKVGTGQIGWLPDHHMRIVVTFVEKVPGLKYW